MEKNVPYRVTETASVTVELVGPDDRAYVESLRVHENQSRFVAANTDSLDEADDNPACVPLIIRAQGKPVGFAMYALDEDDGNYWLYRLMIDARFQGRGYGSAALSLIISRLSELPGCSCIMLGVKPGNDRALGVYERAGFQMTGDTLDGELVMRYEN